MFLSHLLLDPLYETWKLGVFLSPVYCGHVLLHGLILFTLLDIWWPLSTWVLQFCNFNLPLKITKQKQKSLWVYPLKENHFIDILVGFEMNITKCVCLTHQLSWEISFFKSQVTHVYWRKTRKYHQEKKKNTIRIIMPLPQENHCEWCRGRSFHFFMYLKWLGS